MRHEGREQFAAQRRTALDEAENELAPAVAAALEHFGDHHWWDAVLDKAKTVFDETYREEAGNGGGTTERRRLIEQLRTSLTKTSSVREKVTAPMLTRYVAVATVNAATEAAADADPEHLVLEWVTMHDSHVRASHRAADGQRRERGAPFHVGGVEMRYPGDTSAPIEEWIGCRCVLRPDLPDTTASVWHPDTETTFGGVMTEPTEQAAPAVPASPSGLIPWHGVLTVEGANSGDKRSFRNNSLRNRDLPLPLTWQKVVAKGHDGAVKVARIDGLSRVALDDNSSEIRAHGVFLQNAEADEVVGEMSAFPRVGVSVDLDDATFEVDETTSATEFTDARICSASIVIIPAFDQAWVALGEPPSGFMGETPAEEPAADAPAEAAAADTETAGRGPGWVTNPADTKRLHDYWTVPGQPGYEKIAWGTDGDFERCRAQIGEEIGESSPAKLRFLNQQCAQWHHDATGFWPGKAPLERLSDAKGEVLVSLTASVAALDAKWIPKREWFSNPELKAPTPLTFADYPEGTRVYGHLAEWGTCHLDFPGMCVTPPPLDDGGAEFMLGRVVTDDGIVFTGPLTLGGGHADMALGLRAAKEHYDDATTSVADVVVGPDDIGIWFSGFLHPDVTPAQRYALTAHQLSGDWREKAGVMSLIAAHVVNSPGFGIKPSIHTHDGFQTALVAAGGLRPRSIDTGIGIGSTAVQSFTTTDTAEVAARAIEMYETRKETRERIKAAVEEVGATPQARLARLRETQEG